MEGDFLKLQELFGHRFVVDSRQVQPGDVFVAIKGQRVDGHDFVGDALAKGAFAVLVERDCGVQNQFVVPNTVEFLGMLAKEIVSKFQPKVIGITGSNGKTTTKEIVWSVLNAERPTFKNEGNLNSEIGLPLSIINNYRGEEILVLEMAQRVFGDIKYLCNLFPPDIGVLLNVGSAHVGVAGSLEQLFRGKWQIVEGSKEALVNFDDDRMRCPKCRYFGTKGGHYVLIDRKFKDGSTLLTFRMNGEDYYYKLPGYWTKALTLSVLVAFGVSDMLDIFFNPTGLLSFEPLKGRFNVHKLVGGYLIDDSYNASYESFKMGVEELLEHFPRPIYVVAGAIKELGEYSKEYHAKLSRLLEEVDGVIVCDSEEESKDIDSKNIIYRSSSHEEIVEFLRKYIIKEKFCGTVYFKASRAVQLERIVDKLLEEVRM
uniref:UDP-N-acetylmuramoyl-tripeptide--D-alanyl-D-alanine ligase n=1 Tax=Fervidobacterium thailandense TaxID=1008305 RepID=A0A7C4W201_9BACT